MGNNLKSEGGLTFKVGKIQSCSPCSQGPARTGKSSMSYLGQAGQDHTDFQEVGYEDKPGHQEQGHMLPVHCSA